MVLGILIPGANFLFYHSINFRYDQDQTEQAVLSFSNGKIQQRLLQHTRKLSPWKKSQYVIASASIGHHKLTLHLLATNSLLPEKVELGLENDLVIPIEIKNLRSTGTYYFYGDIPLTKEILEVVKQNRVRFVRIRRGSQTSQDLKIKNMEISW